jgi:hypothetical protein
LGFASALGDLGAGEAGVAVSLAGFNVGVEFGQLAVVAAALPILFAVRDRRVGRAAVNYLCSASCAALAVVWLSERLVLFTGAPRLYLPRAQRVARQHDLDTAIACTPVCRSVVGDWHR